MKKILAALLVVAAAVALYFAFYSGDEQRNDQTATSTTATVDEPKKAGDDIKATDYSKATNWLEQGEDNTKTTDVFMLYPTAYAQKEKDDSPVSTISNASMQAGAQVFMATQGSAFEASGNVYAPYYRQLDATWWLSKDKSEQQDYIQGVPKADVLAAFDYYINNLNNGRPFILVGHSQGAAMVKEILFDYMKEHPELNDRLVAAYVLGQSVTQAELDQNPGIHFAQGADDNQSVISYNTVSPNFTGELSTWEEGSLAINPLNWTTDGTPADVTQNLGSYVRNSETGEYERVDNLADATVDTTRGLLICSSVDQATYEMPKSAQKIFPSGSYHNNDISFYYYNLQANAENRVAQYLALHPEAATVAPTTAETTVE